MGETASVGQQALSSKQVGESPPVLVGQLRVWPAVVMIAVLWFYTFAYPVLPMSGGFRFVSRMLLGLAVLLGFLGWWLTRRAVRRRDRWAALAVAILLGIATRFLCDRSVSGFGLFLSSYPIALTAWTAWLAIAQSLSPRVQRAGFVAVMMLSFGYFALVRFDGVDAVQQAEMSWRWQPTSEEFFLASAQSQATIGPDKDVVAGEHRPWVLRAGDCPEYRGVHRDGVVTGMQIEQDWDEHPPKLLWRQKVGPGWSGMIVVDGHVVTQEQRGDMEAVTCYDAATGDEVWVHEDSTRFEESLSGAGPRGTPTFRDGRIFSMGANGIVNCLDAATGAVVWSRNAVGDGEVAAADKPQWGYSVSPAVVDGLAIVFVGGETKSMLAYRVADGELAWTSAGGKQSYASPQVMSIQGEPQIVMHDTAGLRGINIADGAVLWEHPGPGGMTLPMLQPHLSESGGIVLAMEPGAAMVEVIREGDKWNVEPRWAVTSKFRPGFNDFVIHDGSIYALDDGILACLDLASGERLWKKGRYGHGQILLLADQGALLISSDKGEIILVSVTPEGQEEVGRFAAIEGKTWNSPVLVDGRVFLRNGEEMASFELEKRAERAEEAAATE